MELPERIGPSDAEDILVARGVFCEVSSACRKACFFKECRDAGPTATRDGRSEKEGKLPEREVSRQWTIRQYFQATK